MNRHILIEWPELNLKVRAELAEDRNKELCREFWDHLPFSSIMNNAGITDGSRYCWVPMPSFSESQVKERIDLAPPGRLRYSQNTGNKLIVQYDSCNEDIQGAVLGQVEEKDLDIIREVGRRAREAIFMTKEEIHVFVRRDSEDSGETKEIVVRPESENEELLSIGDELIRLGLEASREEPEEHKNVRTGQNSGMGSCGQYFSTWEFVYSLSRDISMYTLYPIARLCRNPMFHAEQLKRIYLEIEPTYMNLLGAYGMKQLRELSKRVRALLNRDNLKTDEIRFLVDCMTFYTNMISQWTYFYYPWGIGCVCYRFDEDHKIYRPELNSQQ